MAPWCRSRKTIQIPWDFFSVKSPKSRSFPRCQVTGRCQLLYTAATLQTSRDLHRFFVEIPVFFKDLLESNGTSSDLMKFHWHLMAFDGNLWHVFTRRWFFLTMFHHQWGFTWIFQRISLKPLVIFHFAMERFTILQSVNGPVHPEPESRWTNGINWWGSRRYTGENADTLWLCQNSYWKWPFIVDFPIKNGDFP